MKKHKSLQGYSYKKHEGYSVDTFCACEKGWYPIIEEYLDAVEALGLDDYFIVDIKEKFGELRIYDYDATPETEALLTIAEQKAKTTCELCGKEGELGKIRGWWQVLCEACHKKKEAE